MLYNYVRSLGGGFKGLWMFPLENPDAAEISEGASEAMHWMVMNGVLTGDEKGALNPQGSIKRREAAQMLLNLSRVELSGGTLSDAA